LSITTPSVDETSTTNSITSSSSTTTITVIPNDSQNEQTDDLSLNDNNIDQTTFSSLTTTDELVDDRTKYGEKRR
jgi:hypothetical protein